MKTVLLAIVAVLLLGNAPVGDAREKMTKPDPESEEACEVAGWEVIYDFAKDRWICCPKEGAGECFDITKKGQLQPKKGIMKQPQETGEPKVIKPQLK